MARKPRVHFPGALYHVMLRGNGGQEIFFSPEDRFRFFLLVQEGIERYRHKVHAFCLMTTHVHLAIEVGNIGLPRIIQNLAFRYTRWINWRRGRAGHLFQGRYKAVLVDADAYLLALTRYIHLNPVRSGIVEFPENYPWSGHRSYLGLEDIPWLTTEWVLSMFSQKARSARRAYREFVEQERDGGYQREYGKGSGVDSRILGDTIFLDKVLGQKQEGLGRSVAMEEIVSCVCKEFSLREEELSGSGKDRRVSRVRAVMAWLVQQSGCLTLSELSKRVGRDCSTLSTAAKLLEKEIQTDAELNRYVNNIRKSLLEIQISKA
ncbi:MAG: transposase [Deltaproteobacteria bacterium]|nr:transposase [Deltaproteobacteria bacterium]MBM4350992.1 transposase [Deltaproteobacteria bacterium]